VDKRSEFGQVFVSLGRIFENGNANLEIRNASGQTSGTEGVDRYSIANSGAARAIGGARLGSPMQQREYPLANRNRWNHTIDKVCSGVLHASRFDATIPPFSQTGFTGLRLIRTRSSREIRQFISPFHRLPSAVR
jgi:hypothetical protein